MWCEIPPEIVGWSHALTSSVGQDPTAWEDRMKEEDAAAPPAAERPTYHPELAAGKVAGLFGQVGQDV